MTLKDLNRPEKELLESYREPVGMKGLLILMGLFLFGLGLIYLAVYVVVLLMDVLI